MEVNEQLDEEMQIVSKLRKASLKLFYCYNKLTLNKTTNKAIILTSY